MTKKLTKGSIREKAWRTCDLINFVEWSVIKKKIPNKQHLSTVMCQLTKAGWLEKKNVHGKVYYRQLHQPIKTTSNKTKKRNNKQSQVNKVSIKDDVNNSQLSIDEYAHLETIQQSNILNAQPIQLGDLLNQVQTIQQQNAIYKQGFETIAHVLAQMNILESD